MSRSCAGSLAVAPSLALSVTPSPGSRGALWDHTDKIAAFQILKCRGETIVNQPVNAVVLGRVQPREPGRTGMLPLPRGRCHTSQERCLCVSPIRYVQGKRVTITKLFL